MTKTEFHVFRVGILLFAAIAIIISFQWFVPAYVSAEDQNVEIRVSNLSVSPSPANGAQEVRVKFDYQFSLTASGVAYFKEGDTIAVKTNFTEMFDADSSFAVPVRDHGGNQLGELYYDKNSGTATFTVTEAAEAMEFHSFTGSFDSFDHFKANNVDTTTSSTLKAGIGATEAAETPFTINPLQRQLKIQSSGLGTLSGTTGTVTLNEGDAVEVIATPQDSGDPANPNQVLSATLVRADKTTQAFETPTLPTPNTATYNIKYSDLMPGLNSFNIVFTAEVIDSDQRAWGFMDYDDMWKNVWGVDYNSYAQNDISIGGAATRNLYASMGKRLGANAGDKSHDLSDLIIEEHIPGAASGKIWGTRLAIEAIMPNYWPIKNDEGTITGYLPFRKEAGRIGDWSGRVYPKGSTDLIAAGLIRKIEQTAGENYDQFLTRIKNAPLSYGVFLDPETEETSILINLGSPGDPNGPGWKCSELWPEQLSLDPVLNEINGDGNCINGKVQAFRLWFYTDHSKVRYTTHFVNEVYYSATTAEGQTINRAKRQAEYVISRDNALGDGHKSTLTVHVVDALDQAHDIAGVDLKLEKWNEQSGTWEDAKHEGRSYEGLTGDDGELVLGESDGSVETGTLTPGRYRIREVSLPEHYSVKTMRVTTAPSSQGPISADGVFTVSNNDTKGFVALVTFSKAYDVIYHANGGEGELICPNNPHAVGTKATVLAPGDSITRNDYYFVGWNTDTEGNGTWYAPGDEILIEDRDVDLYAQWKLNRKSTSTLTGTKVWDDLNNASGKRPAIDANEGQPVALELINLNGYEFPEGIEPPKPTWKQDKDDSNKWHYSYTGLPRYDSDTNLITWCVVEKPSDDYEVSYENSEEWNFMTDRSYHGGVIKNTLKDSTITYKLNGGTYNGSSDDIIITGKPGSTIRIHDAPEREGYTFLYWKGSEYYPGQEYTIGEDHAFTAMWKKNENVNPNNGGEDSKPDDDTPSPDDQTQPNDKTQPGDQTQPGGKNQSDGQSGSSSKSTKTGDKASITLFGTAFAVAVCLLLILLYRRKRI